MKPLALPLLILVAFSSNLLASDPEIVSRLEEIITIREKAVKEQQILAELGKGNAADFLAAEMAVSEARIELAKELGQLDAVTRELEAIVTRSQQLLAREQSLAEEERITSEKLAEIRVFVLEAEIRLRRHLQGEPAR